MEWRNMVVFSAMLILLCPQLAPSQESPETLQLTPNLGLNPRLSGTLVPDGILPKGYSTTTGETILSDPSHIAVNGRTQFSTPDGRSTSYARGFLTFSLGSLPQNARVVSANIYVPITGLSGYGVYDNAVFVEWVNVGYELDQADYATNGVLLGNYTAGELRQSPGVDVTQGIKLALQRSTNQFTVRIRFQYEHTEEYFNNTEGGVLSIEYAY